MAPEQFTGHETSTRTDIYALGLVLYEMFTGKPAFTIVAPDLLGRVADRCLPISPSSLIPDFDPAIERAILWCLERDPALRPPSVLAMAAALPGGNPLAAALAAGETPSPDMVAAAGDVGSLVSLTGARLSGAHRDRSHRHRLDVATDDAPRLGDDGQATGSAR